MGAPRERSAIVLDELEERLLPPLDVVEDANEWLLGRPGLEQLAERPRDLVRGGGHVSLAEHGFEGFRSRAVHERLRIWNLLDDLDDRPVGDAVSVGKAAAPDDGSSVERGHELRDQPRLADSGRAEDGDEMAGSFGRCGLEGVLEELQLPVAPDHGRVPAAGECGGVRVHRHESVRGERLRLPLRLERRHALRYHRVADEAQGVCSDEDLARLRGLFEACGDVDGIAGREALLGSRHDLARVDPDAQREGRAEVAFELGVQLPECAPELRGRPHGSQRVVLVDVRDAEDGHDGVADELLDRASVPLDHVACQLEVAGEDAAQAFRIEPLAEGGRARDVGEDHCDDLPLLGGARFSAKRSAAGVAEPRACRILLAATRADGHSQKARTARARLQPQLPACVDSRCRREVFK